MRIALIGAGRIGAIHAGNVAELPNATLSHVIDVNLDAAKALAARFGADAGTDAELVLGDRTVDAVVIASATNTHVDLIVRASQRGKAIFCEKPIDLDLERVDRALVEVEKARVPFFVGFNRRFDPSFRQLRSELVAGAVGKTEMVTIISRDPGPPPRAYLQVSGGLFRDMMIHDLDMARWLLAEEPISIHAVGSALVDASVAEIGDIDTAMVTMKTASGALCHISNSRRAAYGYDQRIEVLGSKGLLSAGNQLGSTVSRWTEQGITSAKPLHFFLERYRDAYRAELRHFVESVSSGGKIPLEVGARDGRAALVLADAALRSLREGQPVAP